MNLLQKNDKGRAGMRKILLKAMAIDRGQVRVGADLGIPIDAIAALYSVSGKIGRAHV